MLTLAVRDIGCTYGSPNWVIRSVSMDIVGGELVWIDGPNGSGKTTLLLALAGVLPLSTGRIVLDGKRIDHLGVYRRRSLGIALVPQSHGFFGELTIRENLLAMTKGGQRAVSRLVPPPALKGLINRRARSLSSGESRLLAITIGIASGVRILLLDEPLAGLAPGHTIEGLYESIDSARNAGVAVVATGHHGEKIGLPLDKRYQIVNGEFLTIGPIAQTQLKVIGSPPRA